MKWLVSRKVIIGAIFILLAVVGMFLKSPIDGEPVTTMPQVWLVVVAAFGVTAAAKLIQKAKLNSRYTALPPPYVSFLEKLWKVLDESGGFAFTIGAFAIASLLLYYRVILFEQWLGYHTTLMILFDTVNVARK